MTKKKVPLTPKAIDESIVDAGMPPMEADGVDEATNDAANPNTALIDEAIAEGKALIDQGKTKIEAAMAIYQKLENESQETVVDAFIQGASLTPKGALTYWYNCRRKLKRQRALSI